MKPNQKNNWKKRIGVMISCGILFILCSPVTDVASAQSEDSFQANLPSVAPIRDPAVRPADFQKITSQDTFLDHNIALDDSSTQPAIDENTQPGNENDFGLLDLDQSASWFANLKQQMDGVDFVRVLGSLAIVLGGYLGFVWLTRKIGNGTNQGLPQEVVEVLGQTPFGQQKSLQLVRLGSKLLLLISSNEGTQCVGEITDPHEVEYLASLCGAKKNSQSAIAIRKASTSQTHSNPHAATGNDLKQILRQLQQSGDGTVTGSVFEA